VAGTGRLGQDAPSNTFGEEVRNNLRLQRRLPEIDEQGAALITALLTAALVSMLAVALISRQELDIRRTANVIHGDQALLYARGVETWATYLLSRNKDANQAEYIGKPLAPILVEGGHVTGRADDLQGLFNLNNLVFTGTGENWLEYHRQQFRRLLATCEMNEELVEAVVDWLDSDQELTFPSGAEDREYLNQKMPYRTADRPMVSPGELNLVRGFSGEKFDGCLRPLVSALPEATKLNINSAPAPLVASLSDRISRQTAEQVVADRPANGFETVEEFVQLDALAAAEIQAGFLDVKSDFFMLQSEAAIGQNQATIYSLVHRQDDSVQVLRRSPAIF
jgi:general secretion pathway protein K